MAKANERRKNFWDDKEDEDDVDLGVAARRRGQVVETPTKVEDSADIDRKINETRALMEQTHQLYQQYFSGVERRPPLEKVKFLETKVGELQRIGTNVTTARFKITQFISQYTTMKELWERKLREKERIR